MDLNELLIILKENFPEKTKELSSSLELLRETIQGFINTIKDSVNYAMSREDFESPKFYLNLGEELKNYNKRIGEILNLLQADTQEQSLKRKITGHDTTKDSDSKVERLLTEDLTSTKPRGFSLDGGGFVKAKSWKEVLIYSCQVFYSLDSEKLKSLTMHPDFEGIKRRLIGSNPEMMRKPQKIEKGIFIETHLSANGIRDLLVKLLKAYGFTIEDFKVYLRT